jgi:hypothetical protein
VTRGIDNFSIVPGSQRGVLKITLAAERVLNTPANIGGFNALGELMIRDRHDTAEVAALVGNSGIGNGNSGCCGGAEGQKYEILVDLHPEGLREQSISQTSRCNSSYLRIVETNLRRRY